MSNFLPPEVQARVKREYRIRRTSVWALLLSAVALVGVVLLIPTYALLWWQLDALATEVVRTESDDHMRAYETARVALEKAQTLAGQLREVDTGPTAGEVLSEIQKAQLSSISISGFLYEHIGRAVEKVEIRGIAKTREALTDFSAVLERNPLFARASVPVANFAEERDLPFTLSILLAPKDI